ncbi:MAG: pantothenate kinase [Lutibacter sp.]|nr:MAG: pantothenate kinase [Lutibacter sp.]
MNLVIDVGNTRVKVALYKGTTLHYETIFLKKRIISELKKIKKEFVIDYAIISSVASLSVTSLDKIKNLFPLMQLGYKTKIPFKNKYKTPKTLGVDRMALVAAAVEQYPNKNVLVIDAGTCITYDFVDEKGVYSGGAIAPGVGMRYKALHTFTANLPLLKSDYPNNLIGNSTKNAIHSGVVNGVLFEIDGVIEQYKQQNQNLTIVLTGGDTNFLAKRLKNGIFANPIFLLEGLNIILNYNLKND